MYVVSIVAAYQDYQDRCRPHKKDFNTRGTECARAKRLKFTDGCFLALNYTLLLFFDSCS